MVSVFALRSVKDKLLFRFLVGFGGTLLALTVCRLLLDIRERILIYAWNPFDPRVLCRNTALSTSAAVVATRAHYHWYLIWLALPAVVAPSRVPLWLATMPLLLFDEPVPGDSFFWPSLVYVPANPLLADLRPRLAIKLRRHAGMGDNACPPRLP